MSVQKQIRDTKRLLQKVFFIFRSLQYIIILQTDLRPDVKVELERKLKALHLQSEDNQKKQIAKKRASRYHMVKFFGIRFWLFPLIY